VDSREDEDQLLRSVALQNANSILLLRQRAEEQIFQAKEELERKTQELAHSLSMMRATLESTTDGILVVDDRGKATGFNQKFVEMWRMPREIMESGEDQKMLEVACAQLQDPSQFLARVREIYASSPAESHDLLEFADGRVFERFSKIQCINERNVGRVWSFRDITERKRAEQELREQSERFRVTLGSIGDAVITVDTHCRVTFINANAEALTGWSSAEAVGQPVGEVLRLVSERTREPAANPIERALAEGIVAGLSHYTNLIRRDGSEIPIEDSAAPIKNPGDEIIGAVMVFHDVSERRQKELALERSYEAEQQARGAAEQANQAKDLFLAALSHELRTPLTPVLAILSSLRQDAAIPAVLAEDLETVRRNVELEARLIDDLLDLTRITRGKLALHCERVPLRRMIEDAINTCPIDLAAKRLTLVRDFEQPERTILADSARITQIIWNLLKNSIKFTPAGGTITVRSRVFPAESRVTIEVQDTGIGIDADHLDRVFDAFEQGDRKITRQFGGLGLGLAISKAIAESHQGTLTAASAGHGCGSLFRLTLPLTAVPESEAFAGSKKGPSTPSAPVALSMGQRPIRILLVEDHADTAAILARLLRSIGHYVLRADTVTAALQVAEKEMGATGIDLVISDLGLPDGSGLDLMRELSTRYGLRGIALSGYGMDSDLEQSTAAGFSHHLVKPIDIALVRSTIQEMILSS
jgi:PAS domain S-box-containing protein